MDINNVNSSWKRRANFLICNLRCSPSTAGHCLQTRLGLIIQRLFTWITARLRVYQWTARGMQTALTGFTLWMKANSCVELLFANQYIASGYTVYVSPSIRAISWLLLICIECGGDLHLFYMSLLRKAPTTTMPRTAELHIANYWEVLTDESFSRMKLRVHFQFNYRFCSELIPVAALLVYSLKPAYLARSRWRWWSPCCQCGCAQRIRTRKAAPGGVWGSGALSAAAPSRLKPSCPAPPASAEKHIKCQESIAMFTGPEHLHPLSRLTVNHFLLLYHRNNARFPWKVTVGNFFLVYLARRFAKSHNRNPKRTKGSSGPFGGNVDPYLKERQVIAAHQILYVFVSKIKDSKICFTYTIKAENRIVTTILSS